MHPKTLSDAAWQLIKKMKKVDLLEGWTLAGGTGLALQLGHRYSEALDLFRPDEFDSDLLLNELSQVAAVRVQDRSRSFLHVFLEGTRFSFLKAQEPFLFKGTPYRGLSIADSRDIAVMKLVVIGGRGIAVMKLVVIGGRGSRKDFIDLYCHIRSVGSLESILSLFGQRFSKVDYNKYHILKSLVYFDDAENEPMPRMIRKISWEEVKETILAEVRRIEI